MVVQKNIEKIIWGVDPFEFIPEKKRSVVQVIQVLTQKMGAKVLPVYMLTPGNFFGGSRFTAADFQEYGKKAEDLLNRFFRRVRIPALLPPKILFDPSHRVHDTVFSFCEFANESKADLIVVTTHGHRGVKRLVMGSFAETLVLTSEIPVLIMGPEIRVKKKMSRILFPTNFGWYAERCFDQALALAHNLNAKVIVFHSADIPDSLRLNSHVLPFGKHIEFLPYTWEEEFRNQKRRLALYVQRAQEKGVDAEDFLDISGLDLTSAILDIAQRKKVGLIAMPAQSGRAAAFFAGSTTRQVARASSCPVWILHQKARTARQRIAA